MALHNKYPCVLISCLHRRCRRSVRQKEQREAAVEERKTSGIYVLPGKTNDYSSHALHNKDLYFVYYITPKKLQHTTVCMYGKIRIIKKLTPATKILPPLYELPTYHRTTKPAHTCTTITTTAKQYQVSLPLGSQFQETHDKRAILHTYIHTTTNTTTKSTLDYYLWGGLCIGTAM